MTPDTPAFHRPTVVFGAPALALGAGRRTDEELLGRHPAYGNDTLRRKLGAATRFVADADDDSFSMLRRAVAALDERLSAEGGGNTADGGGGGDPFARLGMVVAATSSVALACPSLACRALGELVATRPGRDAALTDVQAHDVLAACAGWLYAMQAAFDHLTANPGQTALVGTAESITRLMDPDDLVTNALFSDAASATPVAMAGPGLPEPPFRPAFAMEHRPWLGALGDRDLLLTAPADGRPDFVKMDGRAMRRHSSPSMARALARACAAAGVPGGVAGLHLVVPHQISAQVLDDLDAALAAPGDAHPPVRRPVFRNLAVTGNTACSCLPICLSDLTGAVRPGHDATVIAPGDGELPAAGWLLGLTAFGGGFAFGAAVVRVL